MRNALFLCSLFACAKYPSGMLFSDFRNDVEYWQTARDAADERLTAMPPLALETHHSSSSKSLDQRMMNNVSKTVWVDPKTTYQSLIGFGGAFTQSSAHVWQSLSPSLQQQIILAYFDRNAGLGYSIGRVLFRAFHSFLYTRKCVDCLLNVYASSFA